MADDLELRKAFFIESAEILERMDAEFSSLEKDPKNMDLVNSIFRGLHTIKGNSSFLSLQGITKIGHGAETILDKARRGELQLSTAAFKILRKVLSDLHLMIVEQEIHLDVKLIVDVMQKFLAGDTAAVKALDGLSTTAADTKVQTNAFVRIDEGKIAKILSVASELDLLRYSFEKLPEKMDELGTVASDLRFELDLQVGKFSRLTRYLSSLIFGVRLVPVNQVFQRFPRVVEELGKKLGKEIKLQIVNGNAQLDKAIVEAIADPLTHLIRNSADHGIEQVAERAKAGKPIHGTIRLQSYVKSGFVYIEIFDDGRGIDGDKILAAAIKKGLVPADKAPSFSESQKLALIFAPGFSTAEKVTDISGRGVGMDVVKSNINKLRGTVIIESKIGVGTVIQLRFPMSMAVIFSLFVDVGGTCCALPVDQIDESMDYQASELLENIPTGASESDYLRVFSLQNLFWEKTMDKQPSYHMIRLKNLHHCAFIVDSFVSIEEAIVQSVDSYVSALPGIQGATVRKDGSVALMLNVENIMEYASRYQPMAYVRRKVAVIDEQRLLQTAKSA